MSDEPRCYVCGQAESDDPDNVEIRPYGEGGKPICFDCMTGDPAREAEAHKQFAAACDNTESDIVVIGDSTGPRAATYDETVVVSHVLPGLPRPGKA